MGHRLIRICLVLLLLPGALVAQGRTGRWTLALGMARESFSGASSDTSTITGARVQVAPSPRLSTELGLGRRLGDWDLLLSAGYASGSLRAKTDVLVLDDRTTAVKRYRGALLVGRRITGLAHSTLLVLAGPVLDHWTTGGVGDRTTLGARAGLALRIPLGAVELENRALFGVGPSPFRQRDLPPEARIESLRSWSVGATLRLGL